MTRQELHAALRALDESDVDLNTWEAGFIESLLARPPETWSEKQIAVATKLVEEHSFEKRGEQEVEVKVPPGTEKYFRRTP